MTNEGNQVSFRSILMYGCEAWKLMKTEAKKLDAFQMIQVHEAHTKNKVAPTHLPPTNTGNHRTEQNE